MDTGIVTLKETRATLPFVYEAKPLKMNVTAVSEPCLSRRSWSGFRSRVRQGAMSGGEVAVSESPDVALWHFRDLR